METQKNQIAKAILTKMNKPRGTTLLASKYIVKHNTAIKTHIDH